MIKIFYGDDRVKARTIINNFLGENYEVIEAENITRGDMDSIFLGVSLFGETRSILLKSLSDNKECWEVLPKYLDTTHKIIIWENSIDKRSVVYKALSKEKDIEFKEFKLLDTVDKNLVFDIFETAYRGNGVNAVKMCEKIETTNEPYMFMGLMVSQAFKKLEMKNPKAIKATKILADTDMAMKSAVVEPWKLIKAALLKISNI